MAYSVTNITGYNETREDFIWIIREATTAKESNAYAELYHCLMKMVADAVTNKVSFSKLYDMASGHVIQPPPPQGYTVQDRQGEKAGDAGLYGPQEQEDEQ